MSLSSDTFHARDDVPARSGLDLRFSTSSAIWSMWPPSGVGQERHWTPYTGPSSPSASAHSFQIVTPWSCIHLTLVSPRRNHSSSTATDLSAPVWW